MLKCGLGFIALLFVFGRYDVFATLIDKIESLDKFTGKAVPLSGRIEQYTAFIHDIFLTPTATAAPPASLAAGSFSPSPSSSDSAGEQKKTGSSSTPSTSAGHTSFSFSSCS